MARLAAMQDFDRARALWEITLIEGLADGGAAMICKFHHALTDGIGGVQIAMNLFDPSEDHPHHEPLPAEPEGSAASWLSGYRDTLRYDTGLLAKRVDGCGEVGPTADVRQRPPAHHDGPIGGGHRGIGVPDRSTDKPDRIAVGQGARPDSTAGCARGSDAAAARGGPPQRWRRSTTRSSPE